MPITFQCRKCHTRITAPESLAGKRGKCKTCQAPVVVPTPEAASSPPPPPLPVPTGPVRSLAELEAEALDALADPKQEESQQLSEVAFDCPMCGDAIKVAIEHAGKRHPCPECGRIITVPVPKKAGDWRDTGPKKPAGAKRDVGPAPEGAWGNTDVREISQETMEEAGLVKEKDRPLTFYQRYERIILVVVPGVPLLLVLWLLWGWWSASTRESAYDRAARLFLIEESPIRSGSAFRLWPPGMYSPRDEDLAQRARMATLRVEAGPEAMAALRGQAALYLLEAKKDNKASKSAVGQLGMALGEVKSLPASAQAALLLELLEPYLRLGGERNESDRGHRLRWDDAQRELRMCIEGIVERPAQLIALRRATVAFAAAGQAHRAADLATQAVGSNEEAKSDALACVAIELVRAGEKVLAEKAAAQALLPFAGKKRPPVTAAIVAAAEAVGKPHPDPGKDLDAKDAVFIGKREGLAIAGRLEQARSLQAENPGPGTRFRAAVALASGTGAKVDAEAAIALPSHGQDWEAYRLVTIALNAGADPEKVVAGMSVDSPLREWARLAIVRHRLSANAAGEEVLEGLSEVSAAGLLGRLELARANVRYSGGWTARLQGWGEVQAAFGWMGAARAMQGK